jgi:hypothetical protein
MKDAASSSLGTDSGNWEINLGEAARPPPAPLPPPGPAEVDGRPSAAGVGAVRDRGGGGVHIPGLLMLGSRDGASGEKLNVRLSGGGTLARVNLDGSVLGGCVWAVGSDVGGGKADEAFSVVVLVVVVVGDASGQVVESGVGGAPAPELRPKSKLKPVSMTGFGGRGRSEDVSTVGAGLG